MRAVLRFALARLFAGSPRDRRRDPVNGHGPNRRGLALALRALKREEEGVLRQVMLPPALVRAIVCRVCGVGWTDIVADVVHGPALERPQLPLRAEGPLHAVGLKPHFLGSKT